VIKPKQAKNMEELRW